MNSLDWTEKSNYLEEFMRLGVLRTLEISSGVLVNEGSFFFQYNTYQVDHDSQMHRAYFIANFTALIFQRAMLFGMSIYQV